MKLFENFGQKLKGIRTAQDITQPQLSDLLNKSIGKSGYGKGYISSLENGKKTTLDRLVLMLELLGCNVQLLVEIPTTKKHEIFISKLSNESLGEFHKFIREQHTQTQSPDLGEKMYLSNWYNTYVDIVPKRGNKGFSVINRENNKRKDFDYE